MFAYPDVKQFYNPKKPKITREFKTRQEFDEALLKNAKYYVAAKFIGSGQYERIENKSLESLYETLHSNCINKNGRKWLIYAICEYCGVDHSIHIATY